MVLKREFYERDTITVAKALLGQIFVRRENGVETSGIIVETEAYRGRNDAAAHSYKGKSERTSVMFGKKGLAYVYMIYGMYYCMNITCGPENEPEVVLLRALEPVGGIEVMEERRRTKKLKNLCSGPGKLCMAMDINKNLYGADLVESDVLFIEKGGHAGEISASKRINIEYSGEARDYLWRFTVSGNPFISK